MRSQALATRGFNGRNPMNVQDCLQTLRAIRDVSFATVDQEGHPQIRIIDVMLVQEGALYF